MLRKNGFYITNQSSIKIGSSKINWNIWRVSCFSPCWKKHCTCKFLQSLAAVPSPPATPASWTAAWSAGGSQWTQPLSNRPGQQSSEDGQITNNGSGLSVCRHQVNHFIFRWSDNYRELSLLRRLEEEEEELRELLAEHKRNLANRHKKLEYRGIHKAFKNRRQWGS